MSQKSQLDLAAARLGRAYLDHDKADQALSQACRRLTLFLKGELSFGVTEEAVMNEIDSRKADKTRTAYELHNARLAYLYIENGCTDPDPSDFNKGGCNP